MKYQALYFDLLVFTSVILVGNGIVVGLVLFYVSRYSETKTREEAISKRLDYMVKYTNIIEENQLELKRFKHDYQNLLLSLSILAESGDLDKIKQKTASLRQYSAQQLLKEYTQYSDLARVHHTLLKSILIAKLTELHHMNIVFRLVCPEPVESLNIADFDLIRMVGILIDNAREHVKDMEDGMIAVSVHKTTHGTHIKVENTYGNQVTSITTLMTPGYSSKDNHSGLGLSNVEKIKNKYDHVFLNYHIDDKFEVTLIIMNEEGEY
jgi:predicted signal transduction protein with a C-terminal ATPase domain